MCSLYFAPFSFPLIGCTHADHCLHLSCNNEISMTSHIHRLASCDEIVIDRGHRSASGHPCVVWRMVGCKKKHMHTQYDDSDRRSEKKKHPPPPPSCFWLGFMAHPSLARPSRCPLRVKVNLNDLRTLSKHVTDNRALLLLLRCHNAITISFCLPCHFTIHNQWVPLGAASSELDIHLHSSLPRVMWTLVLLSGTLIRRSISLSSCVSERFLIKFISRCHRSVDWHVRAPWDSPLSRYHCNLSPWTWAFECNYSSRSNNP